MANLPESSTWESGIQQLETTDAALAGAGGIMNLQATKLGNRTKWLYDALAALSTTVSNLTGLFNNLKYSYQQTISGSAAVNVTLNQNVKYVTVNLSAAANSTITLNAASSSNVGRLINFIVTNTGAGTITIKDGSDIVVIEAASNRQISLLCTQTGMGGTLYFWIRVIDIDKASTAEALAYTADKYIDGERLGNVLKPLKTSLTMVAGLFSGTAEISVIGNLKYLKLDLDSRITIIVGAGNQYPVITGISADLRPSDTNYIPVTFKNENIGHFIVYNNGEVWYKHLGSNSSVNIGDQLIRSTIMYE